MVVGLLWLVPTIGSSITSILRIHSEQTGWWKISPSRARQPVELRRSLSQQRPALALIRDAYMRSNTLLVVVIGDGGYALAWLDFPGRDWC